MLLAILISTALAQANPPKPPEPELLLAVTLPEFLDDEHRPEIRIIFRRTAGKWGAVGGDDGGPAPAQARWMPCGGKVEVATRAVPSMGEDFDVGTVGVHRLAKKKATLPPGEVVLVSGGACGDPEGWKPIKPKTVPLKSVAKAYASESGKLTASLSIPALKADPKSLYVKAAFEASDGRRLVGVATRNPPTDIEADDDPRLLLGEPIWILVSPDGAATALEIGSALLRLADFDGDGKTDVLLRLSAGGAYGFALYTGGFAERTVWQYRG